MTIYDEMSAHHRNSVQRLPLVDEFVRAVERYALLGRDAYTLQEESRFQQQPGDNGVAADGAPSQAPEIMVSLEDRKQRFRKLEAPSIGLAKILNLAIQI